MRGPLSDPPNLIQVQQVLHDIFTAERIGHLTVYGWHLTFTVKTLRHYRVRLDELNKVREAFGVDDQQIEFWNTTHGVEFMVDLDVQTPVETPRGKP